MHSKSPVVELLGWFNPSSSINNLEWDLTFSQYCTLAMLCGLGACPTSAHLQLSPAFRSDSVMSREPTGTLVRISPWRKSFPIFHVAHYFVVWHNTSFLLKIFLIGGSSTSCRKERMQEKGELGRGSGATWFPQKKVRKIPILTPGKISGSEH